MGRARSNTKQEPEQIARFDLHLPASLLNDLKAIADREHRPYSAQMRVAIMEHVERKADPEDVVA